jgi:hypothetical protein
MGPTIFLCGPLGFAVKVQILANTWHSNQDSNGHDSKQDKYNFSSEWFLLAKAKESFFDFWARRELVFSWLL